jgi:long-chain acyl-CoA synthetase
VAWYQDLVSSLTGDLAQFEKIKKVALLPRELSQEAGEITPTLQVKRRVVEARYKELIDDMYRGAV